MSQSVKFNYDQLFCNCGGLSFGYLINFPTNSDSRDRFLSILCVWGLCSIIPTAQKAIQKKSYSYQSLDEEEYEDDDDDDGSAENLFSSIKHAELLHSF